MKNLEKTSAHDSIGKNKIFNDDCFNVFPKIEDESVNLVLTDIPYDEVNREDGGLRNLDKGDADKCNFEIKKLLKELYRISKGTIIIFCGNGQYSEIYDFFKQKQKKGSVRQLIWAKTNPSPMNGQHIYLSGTENAVWFRKRGGTFNAHCKKNFFLHPCGRSKLHPTEKNHKLLEELISDNSNENDLVFDPFMGSGSHCLVARNLKRYFIGIEIDKNYFEISEKRLVEEKNISFF